jgi:hypothetical protein
MLAAEANKKVCNIVHLIYRAKKYEGSAKDYEFSADDGRALARGIQRRHQKSESSRDI